MRRQRKTEPGRRRALSPSNVLLALIGFLFLCSLSVVIVLNLRSIYYYDIQSLHLEEQTGMSGEKIRENYDALIDYNLITKGVGELEFPSFPMSEAGRIHFAEVRRIFLAIQILCIVSCILLMAGLLRKARKRDFGSLKLISLFTVFFPPALGLAAVLNWDTFFVTFHRLIFDNDYWIFDPATDPVILILPDEFFFHCAAAILLFLLLGSIFTGLLYRLTAKGEK